MPENIDLSPIKNLIRHEWDWDFSTFCARLGIPGLDPEGNIDAYAQEKFRQFRTAVYALKQFDNDNLRILCGGD